MIYSRTILDHFLNPRNTGTLPDPCLRAEVTSTACNDRLVLTVAVTDGRIADARFMANACAVATSAMSVLTEMIKGRSVTEAQGIDLPMIETALGGVPEEKKDCAAHAVQALRQCLAARPTSAGS
jgi:NifU-like protein involved in Fe-S cluster formation